jgi:hypothetical protein
MSTSYSEGDGEVLGRLAAVLRAHHAPLFDAGVKVGVLFAVNDTGHAVTGHGYPALATVKVVSLKDRVHKGTDAELVIDRRAYEELTDAQRDALLDHEMSHLALKKFGYVAVKDSRGEPTGETELVCERDDLDRPKLVGVKGDWSAGDGFRSVCRRHGRAAIEFRNLSECHALARRAADEGDCG